MQKLEDVAILMQQDFSTLPITWLLGDAHTVDSMRQASSYPPFDDSVLEFLNFVSKVLLKDNRAKKYPEVITFAFWVRKASLSEKKKSYQGSLDKRLGRGVVFHIAPSNVPVNFAYSIVSGLLSGNFNIVKVSSTRFEQVEIILDAFRNVLVDYSDFRNSLVCVRYGHEKRINDAFTYVANSRLIWGGDETIQSIRQSILPARANEITFSDRYSISVIDSNDYLNVIDKDKVAIDFFNDTYLSDQNACTSPVLIYWLGDFKEEAKDTFWSHLSRKVEKEYELQAVQAVAKYTKILEWSASNSKLLLSQSKDNLITRVTMFEPSLPTVSNHGHSGLFLEYDADTIDELLEFCDETKCQTISYFGNLKNSLENFIFSMRPKGVDRVVPIGKTMNFELVWDGVDLILDLSRIVDFR